MPIRAVIFDLDGTLLDTLIDVATAANASLREVGVPEHPLTAYRKLLGGGIQRLFADALPPGAATPEQVARSVAAFRRHYDRGWNNATRPYAGIPELVDALKRRGLWLAVLSNKPHEFTRACIAAYFGGQPAPTATGIESAGPIGPFRCVVGQRAGMPVKPDPTSALEIANGSGVPPEEFLYLGDTSIDMQTARDAGMHPIGVLWGFRDREELIASGAECVIATPCELLELLD